MTAPFIVMFKTVFLKKTILTSDALTDFIKLPPPSVSTQWLDKISDTNDAAACITEIPT